MREMIVKYSFLSALTHSLRKGSDLIAGPTMQFSIIVAELLTGHSINCLGLVS